MIERVAVAWDGSQGAGEAAEWAARRQGGSGPLELVRVADDETIPADWESTAGTVEGARWALEVEAVRLSALHPDLQVTTTVLIGRREEELARLSGAGTLLVLGTQERAGLRLRFRFSLAVRLAARAAGPVAVVPVAAAGDDAGPVVVGVDGSAASIAAARLGAEEAMRRGTRLVAVHAWREPTGWEEVSPMVYDTFEHLHRQVLDESIHPVAEAFPGLAVERRLMHGPRADVLLAAAGGASELVVGKHARTAARDVLLGTVSRDLLLDTRVPTVIGGALEAAVPLPSARRRPAVA
jgi:nucleotide-binding universal stress UspA family protein